MEPEHDRELVTSRILSATPERVYEAFCDPQRLARWWGPHGFTNTFHAFDFRPGGLWSFTMHGPDGKDFPNESAFVELEDARRVVIEHRSNPRFVAMFEFLPVTEGTQIVFRQVFESREMRDRIAQFVGDANEQNLDRLAKLLGEG
ncbi:MAG: SRPBCC domain-containing protein [Planctomycetes bacterium]|nr:SRPBCC domain-containing protein [Planctomycetota bacterium]